MTWKFKGIPSEDWACIHEIVFVHIFLITMGEILVKASTEKEDKP